MSLNPQEIASLPKSVLQSYPAEKPPPGITPNFDNPPSLVPAILGVGTAFLAPAVLLYSMRMYTKLFLNKKVYWDDLCITLGFAFALVYYISLIFGCTEGAIGRHMWDLHLWAFVSPGSLAEEYTTTVVSAPALGFIKTTLFIQYYMLFWPFRWVRISVWIGSILSATFYLAVTLAGFILNSPRPGQSMLDVVLSPRYLIFAKFSIPIGVISMIIDIYLLVLPIRAVATLQMKTPKKVGLIVVFLTGAFASASSMIGLYYRVRTEHDVTDESWIVSYLHMFTQIEMFAGVSCACMPSAYKFLTTNKLWKDHLKSSFLLSFLLSRSGGRTTQQSGDTVHSGTKDPHAEELHSLSSREDSYARPAYTDPLDRSSF